MRNSERKFFSPCFGDVKEFIEESAVCKRCQHQKQCKRIIRSKLKKHSTKATKTPNRAISYLNTKLNQCYEDEGFEYGVDY